MEKIVCNAEFKNLNLNFHDLNNFMNEVIKQIIHIEDFNISSSFNSNFVDLTIKDATIEDLNIVYQLLENIMKEKYLAEEKKKNPLYNWTYTLDEDNGFVILEHYKGELDKSLVIEPSYEINGKTYKTKFIQCHNMFNINKALETIEFKPGIDCSELFSMKNMFIGCESLKNIIGLENIDTSHTVDMSDMFMLCQSLIDLDLSSFDTSLVTNMDCMFYGCSSLTSVNVTGWNTSKVTNMREMFKNCSSLVDLDLSSFDTSNVAYMGWMFEGCTSLISLDISNFSGKYIDADDMFVYCQSLMDIKTSSDNLWKDFKELLNLDKEELHKVLFASDSKPAT